MNLHLQSLLNTSLCVWCPTHRSLLDHRRCTFCDHEGQSLQLCMNYYSSSIRKQASWSSGIIQQLLQIPLQQMQRGQTLKTCLVQRVLRGWWRQKFPKCWLQKHLPRFLIPSQACWNRDHRNRSAFCFQRLSSTFLECQWTVLGMLANLEAP